MKMSNTGETDINDVFDTIFLSEENIIKEAFREGFEKGKKDGELDGYHAGYHRGAELGAEIGFYKGVTDSILSGIAGDCNDKAKNTLHKLKYSLNAFPKTNNHDINMQSELDDIRGQFKKLCSIMKLNMSYQTFSTMSF